MAIARAIRVAVTTEEEARITTAKEVNPEAYEALLRGKFFYWKTTTGGHYLPFGPYIVLGGIVYHFFGPENSWGNMNYIT